MDGNRVLRWSAWTGAILLGLVMLAALMLAAIPFGWLKPRIERQLSDRFGSHVTIGSLHRLDAFSFRPRVEITEVRVPQPAWAGAGDLATIRSARFAIPVLSLLRGAFRPTDVMIDGMRLSLIRAADRRENWRRSGRSGGSTGMDFANLSVSCSRILYRDAKQDRQFDIAITAAPRQGLRVAGNGTLRGSAVKVLANGAPFDRTGIAWPFQVAIDGPAIHLRTSGNMAAPLATGDMTLDMQVSASDLKMLDAVIDAGLFGTQPIDLSAHAVHHDRGWTITGLTGTIGRSDIAGNITVTDNGGRHHIDGDVSANRLDFSDLASNAGLATEEKSEQATGKRLIPATKVDLTHLVRTDAVLRVKAAHLIGGCSPPLASVSGVLTLDHSLLTISPLRFGLTPGMAEGKVTVDQRNRARPLVTIDMTMSGTTLDALAGGKGGAVNGRASGRIRLSGTGRTIREAMAHADGHAGLFADDGTLPDRLASLIGFDIGRSITSDSSERTNLRCIALGLDVKAGLGRVDPFVIDTPRGRADGRGTISLSDESLAITLHGAPKAGSLLRFPGTATLDGTIRDPGVHLSEHAGSLGTILKALGRTIAGNQGALAQDADCGVLSAQTLSRG